MIASKVAPCGTSTIRLKSVLPSTITVTTLYDDSVAMMCVSPFQGALGCETVLRRRLWGFSAYFGVKLNTRIGSAPLEGNEPLAPLPGIDFGGFVRQILIWSPCALITYQKYI